METPKTIWMSTALRRTTESWVDDYGAGSSEVSDRVAEHYGLKRSLAFARICRYAFDRFKRGMLMLYLLQSIIHVLAQQEFSTTWY